jgi:electron transfer flavoprotein alpha subunit
MATIVFMDHDEGAFNPNSLGVLAKAASLGGEVTAFVGGSGIDDAWAGGLGAYGASKVLVADDAALAGLPQPLVDALEPHAREADAVLFGAGVVSADVAAGLAARVARHQLRDDRLHVSDGGAVAVRPALGDTVMVESPFVVPGDHPGARERVCLEPTGSGTAVVERVAVTADWSSAARMAAASRPRRAGSTSPRRTCWWRRPRHRRARKHPGGGAAGQGAGR